MRGDDGVGIRGSDFELADCEGAEGCLAVVDEQPDVVVAWKWEDAMRVHVATFVDEVLDARAVDKHADRQSTGRGVDLRL
nr:hypothetical protein [Kribbella pratensis]